MHLSKIFFEVRMRHPYGIKTTTMCDLHANRCSKFPQQFLDFKISQKPDPHCKWCDKDFSKMDLTELREAKIIESQQRPVERKGLGENVDTYA